MRTSIKVLGLLSLLIGSSSVFAKESTVQFSYGQSLANGTINYEKNSDQSDITENFSIRGQSANIRYMYSSYTALSLSYYMLETCSIDEAKTKLGCHIDTPIEGGSFEFLTGLNMDDEGVYLFTGVGYYHEEQGNSVFEELYIPLGIGMNLNMFVIEATYQLRNAPHYDMYEYGIFSDITDDYTIQDEYGIAAPASPITVSLGVRF